jgi:uncharacterized protein YwgA
MKVHDFVCFLYDNNMIDLMNLLTDNETGSINRLKLQKYVYLAQACMKDNFGFDYDIYRNGPYSTGLANYYYEEIDLNRVLDDVKNKSWKNNHDFTERFLALFKKHDPDWLELAATLVDSTFYCEDEHECLDKVCAIKSVYSKGYIFDVWNDLKEKGLVPY